MKDKIPVSLQEGKFQMGNITITCHILDDGRRIIDEDSMMKFLEAVQSGELELSKQDLDKFKQWANGGLN